MRGDPINGMRYITAARNLNDRIAASRFGYFDGADVMVVRIKVLPW